MENAMSKLKSLKFVEAQQEQKLTPVEKARSLLTCFENSGPV